MARASIWSHPLLSSIAQMGMKHKFWPVCIDVDLCGHSMVAQTRGRCVKCSFGGYMQLSLNCTWAVCVNECDQVH